MMEQDYCRKIIESSWQSKNCTSETKDAVDHALELIEKGEIRVANKVGDTWNVNQWVKQVILLSFKIYKNEVINPDNKIKWFDKVEAKFANWTSEDFTKNKIRSVPMSFARKGTYIGPDTVLMPSFVNIGAYIGSGCMVDTWATVGSCVQVGNNVHISGGVGLGGVLEPIGHSPVIIEDNCFIGARSEIVEGVIVKERSVISMGVYISTSTKIVDRETGEITKGVIPAGSVVVPGSLQDKNGLSLYCVVIVKKSDEGTKKKIKLNADLRYIIKK